MDGTLDPFRFSEPDSFGFLLVHLVAAFGISDTELSPYCSIRVGAQRAKSGVAEKQIHPIWDEVLNFVVSNVDTQFKVVILNKDILSAREFCSGEVEISQVFHPSFHWKSVPFNLRLFKTSSTEPSGSLDFTLRFIPTKDKTSVPGCDRYGFVFEGFDWKVSHEEQEIAFSKESIDWQCVDRPSIDPTKALLKGIPFAYKASFWEFYSRKHLQLPDNLFEKDCYSNLLKKAPDQVHVDHIDLDIPRTFPGIFFFLFFVFCFC